MEMLNVKTITDFCFQYSQIKPWEFDALQFLDHKHLYTQPSSHKRLDLFCFILAADWSVSVGFVRVVFRHTVQSEKGSTISSIAI